MAGSAAAITFSRSTAKAIWKYIGCSDQSVPSLSNVAMRASRGTKSGEPSVVTLSTKAMIDAFAAPSFQDGNGSSAASAACAAARTSARATSARMRNCCQNACMMSPSIARG